MPVVITPPTRTQQVDDLSEWFGVDPRVFRPLPQSALDQAWLIAAFRWGIPTE